MDVSQELRLTAASLATARNAATFERIKSQLAELESLPELQKEIKGWVTLENGVHVMIGNDGTITHGPKELAGKKIHDLKKTGKKPGGMPSSSPSPKTSPVKPAKVPKPKTEPAQKQPDKSKPDANEPQNIFFNKYTDYDATIVSKLGFSGKAGDFAKAMGLPDDSLLTVSCRTVKPWNGKPTPIVTCYCELDGSYTAEREFRIDQEGKQFCNNKFFVTEKHGGGLGSKMFSAQVKDLTSRGFDRIETHAAGGSGFVGYKVWPKFGYDGPLEDKHKEALKKSGVKLTNINTLQQLYAAPGGREAWEKYGSDIDLSFDLKRGSKSHKILANYLALKEQKNGKATA